MAINLNNFVDIQMKYHLSNVASSTRDTAVLIVNGSDDKDRTYSSLAEVPYAKGSELYYYCAMFFNNGGINLRVITIKKNNKSVISEVYTLSTSTSIVANTAYYVLNSDATYTQVTPKSLGFKEATLITSGSSLTSEATYYIKDTVNGVYTEATPYSQNLFIATKATSRVVGTAYYKYSSADHTFTLDTTTSTDDIYTMTASNSADKFAAITSDNKYATYSSASTYNESYVEGEGANLVLYTLAASTDENFGSKEYATSTLEIPSPIALNFYTKTIETLTVSMDLKASDISAVVKTLPTNQIVVASNASYVELAKVARELNNEDMSIEQKFYISCIKEGNEDFSLSDVSSVYNLNLKYGVPGTEMSIAAYLSQINVDKFQTVKDFAFTNETATYEYQKDSVVITVGKVYEDNDLVTKLLTKNVSVDSSLVNEVRALGGNDTNGNDFVNQYMLILVHQTLTERLVKLLTTKLAYNSSSLSLIGSTISSELERYVNNGYLSTDKAWTENDLTYRGYTVVSKNTALTRGYKYVILPFSTLTDAEKKAHKLPAIYILLADTYSIRKITITGEVF